MTLPYERANSLRSVNTLVRGMWSMNKKELRAALYAIWRHFPSDIEIDQMEKSGAFDVWKEKQAASERGEK